MSDITITNTHTTGTAMSAPDVAANQYDPATATGSFAEINGRLAFANMASGQEVTARMIRDRSMADGRMVGSTANNDLNQLQFSDLSTNTDSYQAIRGASQAFYLPFAPAVTYVTWQIIGAWDGDNDLSAFFHYFMDGTKEPYYFRQLPANSTRKVWMDRVYTGAYMSTDLTRGWHNAHLRAYTDTSGILRIRNASMKVLWIK